MKTRLLVFALALVAGIAQAQTADEILAKYFENTGGIDKWRAVQGIRVNATMTIQGFEFPFEMIKLTDGRTYQSAVIQGIEFKQNVFDGKTLWGTNQQTMKPEKSDSITTASFKNSAGLDFPDPFLDYSSKGYKVELLGKETKDEVECYVVRLTKRPARVAGKEVDNIMVYYFDAETYIPIMAEQEIKVGPAMGKVALVKMSEYQQVDQIMMAFSIFQGIKGEKGGITSKYLKVELDPKVDSSLFVFPH